MLGIRALLVENLLEQVRGGLGEGELAEAGSMEARLALMIWSKVLFFMMFPSFAAVTVVLCLVSAGRGPCCLLCFCVLYLSL